MFGQKDSKGHTTHPRRRFYSSLYRFRNLLCPGRIYWKSVLTTYITTSLRKHQKRFPQTFVIPLHSMGLSWVSGYETQGTSYGSIFIILFWKYCCVSNRVLLSFWNFGTVRLSFISPLAFLSCQSNWMQF